MSSSGLNVLKTTPLGRKTLIQNEKLLVISTIISLVTPLNIIVWQNLWNGLLNNQFFRLTSGTCLILEYFVQFDDHIIRYPRNCVTKKDNYWGSYRIYIFFFLKPLQIFVPRV